MADNVTLNAGSGGDTIAADDVGGAKYQRVKVVWGADGAVNDTSAAAPMPVVQTGTHNIGTVTTVTTVSAVTAISNALPAGTNNIGDVDVLSVVPGTGATNAGKAVDAVAGATDTGVAMLAVRDDALTTLTPADGDYTNLRVDSTGALHVTISSGGVTGRAEDAAHSSGHEGVVFLAVRRDSAAVGSDTDGDYSTINVNSSGRLYVTAALEAGTATNEIVGDAAHDAGIAGNPVRIGARALSADYTAVSTGDTADLIASLTGKQIVLPFSLPGASWSYASSAAVTDTADDEAKAAGGAGVRHYITGVQVFNGHDTTGTEVVIKDGSTVLWRGWAEQTGGGCSAHFNPPLRGTAATAVNVANITNSSSTYFNLQGFSAAE